MISHLQYLILDHSNLNVLPLSTNGVVELWCRITLYGWILVIPCSSSLLWSPLHDGGGRLRLHLIYHVYMLKLTLSLGILSLKAVFSRGDSFNYSVLMGDLSRGNWKVISCIISSLQGLRVIVVKVFAVLELGVQEHWLHWILLLLKVIATVGFLDWRKISLATLLINLLVDIEVFVSNVFFFKGVIVDVILPHWEVVSLFQWVDLHCGFGLVLLSVLVITPRPLINIILSQFSLCYVLNKTLLRSLCALGPGFLFICE